MKLCPKCATLAFDNQTRCSRCGSDLISASPSGAAVSSAKEDQSSATQDTAPSESVPTPSSRAAALDITSLQKSIEAFESQQATLEQRNRLLVIVLGAVAALLAIVFMCWHQTAVRAYAMLDDISIAQDPAAQGRMRISFDVARPGKVRFVRMSGPLETQAEDNFDTRGPRTYEWSWDYAPGHDVEVAVRYRTALWKKYKTAKFPTLNRADIVLMIDTTESMHGYVEGMKEKCRELTENLTAAGFDWRLALIAFGDLKQGEPIVRHKFVNDWTTLASEIQALPRYRGEDMPESALDAIENAVEMPLNQDVPTLFLLITDADYHEPTAQGATAEDVAAKLKTHHVRLSVVSTRILRGRYAPLITAQGRFYVIGKDTWTSILTAVHRQIAVLSRQSE